MLEPGYSAMRPPAQSIDRAPSRALERSCRAFRRRLADTTMRHPRVPDVGDHDQVRPHDRPVGGGAFLLASPDNGRRLPIVATPSCKCLGTQTGSGASRMIVTLASAWSASNGGINAFNYELARALEQASGQRLVCAVTDASVDDVTAAARDGVTLIKVTGTADGKPSPDCAQEIIDALGTDDPVRLWIGHDLVSGEAAVNAAADHGGEVALIHHMDYQSYQNISGDRGDAAYDNHTRQTRLLQTPGATLFGVGSWLAANAARLGGRPAHCLIPGFPAALGSPGRASADRLLVVSAGRFDEKAEPLKRVGTALEAFAMAVRDGADWPLLRSPAVTMLGVDPAEDQKMLHARAAKIAGRPVNVVPAAFRNDPTAVARLAATSHLVIVPSRHEGFGLVGWEAIGTETPLIIGSNTGLANQLRTTLDGTEVGLLNILDLDGGAEDRHRIALAIKKVASDLDGALRRASKLKSSLQSELGCTWSAAATTLLTAMGMMVGSGGFAPMAAGRPATRFSERPNNPYDRCVELNASAAQGSTRQSVEVVAELRFGVAKIKADDIEAQLSLKRVTLGVKPRIGRIAKGDRLGEGARAVPGVEAHSGGIWMIELAEGSHLTQRLLGSEALCVVESTGEDRAVIDLEVTADLRDVQCKLFTGRKLSKNQKKVIDIFLKDRIYHPVSGEVILSSTTLSEDL